MIENSATQDDIEEFIINFFFSKNSENCMQRSELLPLDYFAAELVDSFGAIEMIGAIEEAFELRFEFSDFENPNFKIVEGLIDIIRAKLV